MRMRMHLRMPMHLCLPLRVVRGARRVARGVQLLVCLIFLGVVGIIIYRVVDPEGSEDNNTNNNNNAWNSGIYDATQNSRLLRDSSATPAADGIVPLLRRRELRSLGELAAALEQLMHGLRSATHDF